MVLVFSLAGCGGIFGKSLSPASSRATVTMHFGTLQSDASGSVSRAIVQGGGYLYIRTIGGPTGTLGPFYGPYAVSSGGTFTTSDIPSGTYSRLFVIYSGKLLNDPTKFAIMGGSYSFLEFMAAPDDLLTAFLDEKDSSSQTVDPGKEALGNSFGGMASFGEKANLTLSPGGTTNLSMILSPISSSNTEIQLWQNSSYTFSSTTDATRFYRLNGINVTTPVTSGNLICRLFAGTTSSGSIKNVAFFDSDGNALATTKTGSSLTGGYTWTMEPAAINSAVRTDAASGSSYVELIIYIEFSGTVYAQFSNSVPPNVAVWVDGDATAAWKGHKLLFAIYNQSAYANMNAGQPWELQAPVGLGILSLDSTTGDSTGSTMVSSLTPGATYYISAQVDSGDHYASMTDFSGIELSKIVPYRGDLLSNGSAAGLIPFTAGSVVSLSAANFIQNTDYVYFVSSSGGGSGATPSSPMQFSSAVSAVNALSAGSRAQVYVMDNIGGLGITSFNRPANIKSYGYTTYTLSGSGAPSGNFFSISASSNLVFERMTIDASSASSSQPIINAAGPLTLGYGTTLKGTTSSNSTSGAGVYSTIQFTMNGSMITNCAPVSAGSGGGLNLAGGTATLTNGATITGCGNATMMGGAIYTAASSTLNLDSASITNNASAGGAIYYQGTVNAKVVNFSGNTNGDKTGGGTWNQL